jgi:N,N'-diacetyllegionaminate synthase
MDINGTIIGKDVFVIAEIGINHGGDTDIARKLIDEAVVSGVSAVKFQTYITEKRVAKDSPIFDILKKCELSFDEERELFDYASEKGITAFSTPFDEESVDFLASVDSPCYKIASFDLVNKELLKKVAQIGRPVIMSRGMADQKEIDEAVEILNAGGVDIALLHCVSAYPVNSVSSLNLATIRALGDRYNCPIGFSDHTVGTEAAQYAVAAGANIIEKHFTLSREADGPDHALSTEPVEMKSMVAGIRRVKDMMGTAVWGSVPEEKDILKYRRVS